MHSERNLNYDLMRLLGLLIIMIAHASPPYWLFQLRNFGTPLLVIGSALTYALIYSNRKINIRSFYYKRLTKLALPVWIFLSVFFFLAYIGSKFTNENYPFLLKTMLSSYAFFDGIGFVWIFKIYIILALITPAAINLNNRIKSNFYYFLLLIVVYISYEIVLHFMKPILYGITEKIFNSIIFIVLPYSILYFYGFRLARLKKKSIIISSAVSFVIFFALMLEKYAETGGVVPTQAYKYPPTIYYLSYAFFAINIIYICISKINELPLITKEIIVWLSSNSLWIYLWHIMAFYLWGYLLPEPKGDIILFLAKTIFLLSFGITIVLLQNRLVANIFVTNMFWRRRIFPLLSGSNLAS